MVQIYALCSDVNNVNIIWMRETSMNFGDNFQNIEPSVELSTFCRYILRSWDFHL